LDKIRTLLEGPVGGLVDRIAYRFAARYLIQRLDLDHRGRGDPYCGCEIAPTNLLSAEDRLQIIFSLGGGAPRFEDVWLSSEAMGQTLFGCSLHCLCI
jgi:hypothetical protein